MSRPGPAAAFAQCWSPSVVVVGRVSTDGVDPRTGLLPLVAVPGVTWSEDRRSVSYVGSLDSDKVEYLWQVSSQVAEVYASGVELPVAYPPVPDGNSSAFSGRSVMHLRVNAATAAGGRPFNVDLGQSIEFYAQRPNVELVGPQGSVAVVAPSGQQTSLGTPALGLLFTSSVGVRIEKLEASRTCKTALFTQSIYVPANTTTDVTVPTAAQKLTMYGESSVSPVMRWVRDSTLNLGIVDWDPLRPRLEIDVPSANVLRVLPVPSSRLYTFVWTIAP